ncbi:hypothetical protein D3C73_1192130 [compost metagenome]
MHLPVHLVHCGLRGLHHIQRLDGGFGDKRRGGRNPRDAECHLFHGHSAALCPFTLGAGSGINIPDFPVHCLAHPQDIIGISREGLGSAKEVVGCAGHMGDHALHPGI